jgi:hypothetical protein
MALGIRWGFLAALAAGFVVFLSMILTVFDVSGTAFLLSLAFLLGMLVFSSVAMGGAFRGKRWGWLFVMFVCLITMLFAYVVYLVQGATDNLMLMVAASIILFVVAIVNIALADDGPHAKPKVRVYEGMEKVEPYYEQSQQKTASVKAAPKKASHGKFVASKMASTFHFHRCEWVPNIKRRNRIWFTSAAAARKAKFKPHECVK